jgi:hypothetical protein
MIGQNASGKPKFGPQKALLYAVVTKPRRGPLFAKKRAEIPYF